MQHCPTLPSCAQAIPVRREAGNVVRSGGNCRAEDEVVVDSVGVATMVTEAA
jgi:hypothetical protein